MKFRNAPRKNARGKSLVLTFLLLLSIPIFVIGLLQDRNFDLRNRAFDEIEVSERNPCVISFPSVNPYSLEIGSTFRVQVDALSTTLGIQGISIKDESNNDLFQQTYPENPKRITESFTFTPTVARAYEFKGIMLDLNKKSYECVISSTYDVQGVRAITNNSKPEFKTTPKNSKPSQSIKTGEVYEYTLVANDVDGDTINYSYSFTPGADWLKATVIEDGGNGNLTIKFRGSTKDAASYLANIFIHDGYSRHLSSQSWVISVSPAENDNPSVMIIEPSTPTRITTADTLTVKWDAQDNNHIVNFELFVSSNPTNENSWITIHNSIPYNQTSYDINTKELKDGTYRVIIRATDNQQPAATGLGISEEIIVAKGQTTGRTPDDQVLLPEPQVINISPTSTDEVSNNRPTIKATLISSEGEKIDEDSVVVKLDDVDITKEVKVNRISDTEYTIIYLPQQDISSGLHKVDISFKDTGEREVNKSWTFSVTGDDVDDEMLNIFGYSLSKRIILTIIGGIALILLAIFVPMIIFAVWKDGSEEYNEINTSLPPSLPEADSPPTPQPTTEVENLVTEKFEAPEPVIPQTEVFEAPAPVDIPEPGDDLDAILDQVQRLKEEDNQSPSDKT